VRNLKEQQQHEKEGKANGTAQCTTRDGGALALGGWSPWKKEGAI